MDKSISIVLATHNGANTIRKTLDSITQLTQPEGYLFNVVVVDNGSKDDSFSIIKSYENQLKLIALQEFSPGKNSALNTALTQLDSLGDIIIFTDDDVIFSPDTLEKYIALGKAQPDFDLFGGAINPYWQAQPKQAMLAGIPNTVAFALTPQDAGYSAGQIDAIMIHGPNMAVRKRVFESGMRYNDKIGPNGKNYVMGSETDFLHRAQEQGYKAYWDPNIAVQHIIRPYQYEISWLKNRAYKAGRSLVYVQQRNGEKAACATLLGYPRWALKDWAVLTIKMWIKKGLFKDAEFYHLLWKSNHLRGYISEFKSFYHS